MNLLLLLPDDFISSERVQIRGRRLQHVNKIIKAKPGDYLKTGLLNGEIGRAKILTLNNDVAELALELTDAPPPPLAITLILALPRPKMLRRILQAVTSLGVKQIHLIGSWRVEKSYWQSPFLAADKIHEQLLLGLEQAIDTRLPEVHRHPLFKPFVEDELDTIAGSSTRLIAHPHATTAIGSAPLQALTLAIGPEGGFIPYEVEKLAELDFTAVSLGPRILTVEVAVSSLVSRLAVNLETDKHSAHN
ncbi:MAG: 16S rRNA (uracil(1498)-N(3))-methyltransferase [Gammaproteobacteria bacterium]|nr:16S rRNA (uracil(1498)-N(3))-methyltransferase [Gammaproteobacteria bacterium]MBQ0840552.1 16S rRNA (uracil(1498)-N(3))-methyltransferase [Gammaproteobacteria bacterium]